jgi:hypothetical protein
LALASRANDETGGAKVPPIVPAAGDKSRFLAIHQPNLAENMI